jgi:hypothetical protein
MQSILFFGNCTQDSPVAEIKIFKCRIEGKARRLNQKLKWKGTPTPLR